MTQQIEYWFTAGSTYNYLTAQRIGQACGQAGVPLVLKPFYLGDIFKEAGFWPFHPDTARTRYMWHDIARSASQMGLSPTLPAPYPAPQTPLANRVAFLADAQGVGLDWLIAAYVEWFHAGHLAGEDANLRPSLKAVGLDPDEIIAAAQEPATEAALQALTQEARDKGIFGAPSFWVDGELFWGNDRLEAAIAHATK